MVYLCEVWIYIHCAWCPLLRVTHSDSCRTQWVCANSFFFEHVYRPRNPAVFLSEKIVKIADTVSTVRYVVGDYFFLFSFPLGILTRVAVADNSCRSVQSRLLRRLLVALYATPLFRVLGVKIPFRTALPFRGTCYLELESGARYVLRYSAVLIIHGQHELYILYQYRSGIYPP